MTLLLWLARLALPTLMVVGLLIDTRFQIAAEDIEKTIGLETESAVSSSESLTSTWYCPTAYSRKLEVGGVEAQSELVITNTAAEPTRATIHLISPTSARRLVRLEVPGLSTRSLEVADHTTDELVSALVEAPISGVAVSRRIRSTYGSDVASCSSVVADAWYVVSGDTQADAVSQLVVYNPLPTDAVVDLSFASDAEAGLYVPKELVGMVVPAANVISIDIGAHVRRRDVLSATVRARLGRVVVDHLQRFDGSSGRVGFSATLASATTSTSWYHPVARLGEKESVSVVMSNPTDVVADVEVTVVSGEGKVGSAITSVGPYDVIQMRVLPKAEEALIANTLFTPVKSFGIIVESSSGIPIVSGIELGSGPNGSPGKESPKQEILAVPSDSESMKLPAGRESGFSVASGAPGGSRNWLLVLPDVAGEVVVAVENTTSSGVTALISRYGKRERYELQLAAFAIQHLRLSGGSTIEVKSGSEVAVTAVHQEPKGAGLSSILGIRFAEGG
ncbi:MAG: hypothetical protein EVA19_06685 [Acidimicrobiales bacterium]|nr:MAG: hypothetical protein EVA19_06685 [Acidimicrobiales bacterium]